MIHVIEVSYQDRRHCNGPRNKLVATAFLAIRERTESNDSIHRHQRHAYNRYNHFFNVQYESSSFIKEEKLVCSM